MSVMRLAILDSDSGFVRVLVKRADDLGWQYRRSKILLAGGIHLHAREAMVGNGVLGPGSGCSSSGSRRAADSALSYARPIQRLPACRRGLSLGGRRRGGPALPPEEVLARVEAVVRRRKRASARVDTDRRGGDPDKAVNSNPSWAEADPMHPAGVRGPQLLAQAKGQVLQRENLQGGVGHAMVRRPPVDVIEGEPEAREAPGLSSSTPLRSGLRFDGKTRGGKGGEAIEVDPRSTTRGASS